MFYCECTRQRLSERIDLLFSYICVFYSEQMCVDAHAQRQIPFSLKKKNIIILLSLLLLNLFRFCFLLLSTQHLLGV